MTGPIPFGWRPFSCSGFVHRCEFFSVSLSFPSGNGFRFNDTDGITRPLPTFILRRGAAPPSASHPFPVVELTVSRGRPVHQQQKCFTRTRHLFIAVCLTLTYLSLRFHSFRKKRKRKWRPLHGPSWAPSTNKNAQ